MAEFPIETTPSDPRKQAHPDGFWNSYRITAQGSRVRVEMNGSLVSEGDVPQALTVPGRIALQFHTGKVQFRAIRVKRL